MRKDADEVALLRAGCAGRGPGRDWRSRPGGSSGGPRRTSRARSASGSSRRATTRPSSGSSPRGPNSASPHHDPGERVIPAGEPIVIDIGGTLGGYGSDITRTVWVTGGDPATGPDAEFLRLYAVLQGAQEAATAAVRPGVPCERDRRGRARDHRRRGLRPEVLPPDRPRHRPRGSRGAVPGRGQPRAAGRRAWRSAWSPGSTSRAGTGHGSRTSSCAATTGPVVLNEVPRDLLVVPG